MAEGGEIGKITVKRDGERLEWCIPDFWKLPTEVDSCFTSPFFVLLNTLWYLAIYPNGFRRHGSERWIGLYLHKGDSGNPKTIYYTLGIKRANGVVEDVIDDTISVYRKGDGWGAHKLLPRISVHSDIFTVTCRLRSEKPRPLQGGRLSPAPQAEIVNVIKRKSGRLSPAPQAEILNVIKRKRNFRIYDSTKGPAVLSEQMKKLLTNGDDHDVILKVENRVFRAHKCILRARCPVFAEMVDMKWNHTSTISIEDCDPEAFGEFLLYVYTGKTAYITPSNFRNIRYLADKYDLPDLRELCLGKLPRLNL